MGDIINPAYELFIFAADEHFKAKRQMLYVGTLTQAWEVFFSTFAYSNYLTRPFFAHGHTVLDCERFNRLSSQLTNAIRKFAFDSLRNPFLYDVKRLLDISTLALWQARFSEF